MGKRVVSASLQPIVRTRVGPPSLRGMLFAVATTLAATVALASAESSRDVCFTPGGDCTEAIVTALENARISVLVQAYTFTSAPIAKALLEASRRGVKVEAILDAINRRSARYSGADLLARAGIPVRIDAAHAIAHNKVMVIDGSTVITGSFNFTRAAQERNAENLLVIHDPALAARYTQNWQVHAAHSEPYTPR
jgi:phosphatidylserine/phosphatidylglycerophosphate/cardiolipin synthase-like enzyme